MLTPLGDGPICLHRANWQTRLALSSSLDCERYRAYDHEPFS
jgi:hypothetical protein